MEGTVSKGSREVGESKFQSLICHPWTLNNRRGNNFEVLSPRNADYFNTLQVTDSGNPENLLRINNCTIFLSIVSLKNQNDSETQ